VFQIKYIVIQDPKDIYPVGRKIEYSCADGHDHFGDPIAECTENLTWRRSPMECKSNSLNYTSKKMCKIIVIIKFSAWLPKHCNFVVKISDSFISVSSDPAHIWYLWIPRVPDVGQIWADTMKLSGVERGDH